MASERTAMLDYEDRPGNYEIQPNRPPHDWSALAPSGESRQEVDDAPAANVVVALLAALRTDLVEDVLAEAPAWVAAAYAEMLERPAFELTTVPNEDGNDELILTRDIPFRSICLHHLLPFFGVAHVGYLPGARLAGPSKIARVVSHYAAGLQVQERLTAQIADCLAGRLGATGVGVVLEAQHTCMTVRDALMTGPHTVTLALRGLVREDRRARHEFMSMVR